VSLKEWLGGDRAFRVVFATVGVCGGVLAVGALALRGGLGGVSVLVGAMIALGNLYVLRRILSAILAPHSDAASHGAAAWSIISLGKLMFLFTGMWLLMTRHLVAPMELFVGYLALPIGIAIGALVSDKTDPEPPPEPPAS
jgi:hypothetical protein